jgi:hypothetical protein
MNTLWRFTFFRWVIIALSDHGPSWCARWLVRNSSLGTQIIDTLTRAGRVDLVFQFREDFGV